MTFHGHETGYEILILIIVEQYMNAESRIEEKKKVLRQ